MTKLDTTACNGRNNANGVAILRGRILFREITNILVVHVHIDEAAQFAVFGKEMFAQFPELRGQMAERFPDSLGAELDSHSHLLYRVLLGNDTQPSSTPRLSGE